MKTITRILLTLALVCCGVSACKTVGTPKAPPVAVAAIDCALPSLWNAVTVDAVERDVASAVAQHDPLAALEILGESVGEAEVTCVVAKENAGVKLSATTLETDGGVQKSVTQKWLDHEAAKGLHVTNFGTLSP